MASLASVIQAIVDTSEDSSDLEEFSPDEGLAPEDLFREAVFHALNVVNDGENVSPYEFEEIVIMNFLLLAEESGFTLRETNSFLRELLV